ncbi:MAG: hypothetical protein M0P73_06050 [Syntrophobacterales bacterium]|jgi:hypothetical protein|nr:hypothetical protein [Syntrophobacterales bacterium]
MIYTDICNSIEGQKVSLQCRKFTSFRPRVDSKMTQSIFPFKLAISSLAIISEELEPKEHRFRPTSILDQDACLLGETIDGFSLKPLSSPKIVHGSAKHEASLIYSKGFVYAHIEIGVRALLQKKEKEK